MTTLTRRCGLVACGLLVDRVLGEPPTEWHPVAWFGTGMGRVEAAVWADDRARGGAYAAVGVATGVIAGRVVPWVAPATAVVVAGRELRRVAATVGERLEAGDLAGARDRLPSLVGRDPSGLDESGIAAAVIESVAENTVDAVVAAAVWAVVGGASGAFAYRAVNTMDAMVGRRNDRYRRFGTAAARLDDGANWVPARLTACLIAAARPGRRNAIARVVRRDAPAHPSPNAGVAEAAMAAAIDRQLGGPLRYGDVAEVRPTLGDGARPGAADVDEAIAISDRAERVLVVALAAVSLAGALQTRRSS